MIQSKRLKGEARRAKEPLPEGIVTLAPEKDNLTIWNAQIKGPVGTPYEGGVFGLKINIPNDYPLGPPEVKFTTRIYHPNISSTGFICVSILKKRTADGNGTWAAATMLPTLMLAIQSLLADPNADDPLVESIAEQLQNDPEKFSNIARKWTQRYASPS